MSRTPKKLALCVGINSYPGTGANLNGCVNDAISWENVLKSRGFTVARAHDAEAYGHHILQLLSGMVSVAGPGDTVVFTYSGHGSQIPDRDGDEPDHIDECICPSDVVQNGPISDDALHEIYAARRKLSKLIVISDSCFSGTITRAVLKDRDPRPRFLLPEKFLPASDLARLAVAGTKRREPQNRSSGLLLSGCRENEVSYDAWIGGRYMGAFTHYALSALVTNPHETYRGWMHRIRLEDLPNVEYPQSPQLYGPSYMKSWRVFD